MRLRYLQPDTILTELTVRHLFQQSLSRVVSVETLQTRGLRVALFVCAVFAADGVFT